MRTIRNITFDTDTVSFTWVELPQSLRENGLLSSQLVVPIVDEMVDVFDELQNACEETLAEALKFFHGSAQMSDRAESDDEDETSPYDNPEER